MKGQKKVILGQKWGILGVYGKIWVMDFSVGKWPSDPPGVVGWWVGFSVSIVLQKQCKASFPSSFFKGYGPTAQSDS